MQGANRLSHLPPLSAVLTVRLADATGTSLAIVQAPGGNDQEMTAMGNSESNDEFAAQPEGMTSDARPEGMTSDAQPQGMTSDGMTSDDDPGGRAPGGRRRGPGGRQPQGRTSDGMTSDGEQPGTGGAQPQGMTSDDEPGN